MNKERNKIMNERYAFAFQKLATCNFKKWIEFEDHSVVVSMGKNSAGEMGYKVEIINDKTGNCDSYNDSFFFGFNTKLRIIPNREMTSIMQLLIYYMINGDED